MFRKVSFKCQGGGVLGWGVGVRRRLFRTGADGGTAALPAGICIIKTLPTFSLSFRSCGL